jgi:hypothetical protein
MPQIGAIVINDTINVQAMINLLKADPRITMGKETLAEDGSRYIPIEKNT